ncbi:hypothetical protein FF2_022585 [Malus domestica]
MSIATLELEDSYQEQYSQLWDYCNELNMRNPRTNVVVKSELEGGKSQFQRLYMCLAACKQGFLDGCRPLICLDGCHIKGIQPSQLLAVVTVDANNGMFPLAYAITKSECYDSWKWFLEILREDLKIENSHSYVFMMDKQKGLIDAVDQLFPNAEHRHCLKHLYANFNKDHKGLTLKLQMESIAILHYPGFMMR